MILLGQHGKRQDYTIGLDYIRLAAQTCDQNAPQGAYVSQTPSMNPWTALLCKLVVTVS